MPFQKGKSGNPNGKRSEALFYAALDKALKDHKDGPDKRLFKIANNLVKAAEASEQWAIREIADRLDGKPALTVNNRNENVTAREMSDAELLSIASGSGSRDVEAEKVTPESDRLH